MSGHGKVVFVGNCSYDLTEEQLVEIFREAGPVASFRLVMDRDTGRSRGYGFCEYADAETASSAVRNLNNYEISGRRIRVDFADSEAVAAATSSSALQQSEKSYASSQQQQHKQQPQQPPSNTAADAITALLASMSSSQLFDVMTQMKLLVQTSQEQAKNLLTQNPQLCYALYQAMIIMKVIRPEIVTQVLQNALQQQGIQTGPPRSPVYAAPTAQLPMGPGAQQQQPQQQPAYRPMMPPSAGQPGGMMMMPQQQQQQQQAQPTQQQQHQQHPATPQSAGMMMGFPANFAHLPEAQRGALIQIMHMTEADMMALPVEQRQQVQALKAQLAAGGGGQPMAPPPGAGVMRR